MKKLVWTISFLLIAFFAKAQKDSITVVIECDSLYQPFLDSLGSINVMVDSERYKYRIGKKRVFKIPLPKDSTYNFLEVEIGDWWDFLTGVRYMYSNLGYRIAVYNYRTGRFKKTEIMEYNFRKTIDISIPIDSKTDKYMIDNTCPKCSLKDNVSWIAYGFPMEDPITGEFKMDSAPFYNPYNNPFVLPHYLGGCEPRNYHWYCNRCERMY